MINKEYNIIDLPSRMGEKVLVEKVNIGELEARILKLAEEKAGLENIITDAETKLKSVNEEHAELLVDYNAFIEAENQAKARLEAETTSEQEQTEVQ